MKNTTNPLPVYVLSFDDWDRIAEVKDGYALPDYTGVREGQGDYADLYAGPPLSAKDDADGYDRIMVGRIWTNDQAVGLLHTENEDLALYTETALRLRLMKQQGLSPREAFDATLTEFDTGPVYTGDLEDIADPDIELNEGL